MLTIDEARAFGSLTARLCLAPLRASFHVYNTESDVDAALSALLD